MANKIDTPAKRNKLATRREPHWHSFAKGRALGYRKINNGGSWIVKSGRKQSRLGDVSDYTYGEALERAMKITKYIEAGDPKSALTVHDVFKQYQIKKAADQGEQKSLITYRYYEKILPASLLNVIAADVTIEALNEWKYSQVFKPTDEPDSPENLDKVRASKASANRRITIFKAALNNTFGNSFVGAWSELKKFSGVAKSRDLFLTVEQVQAWLENTAPPLHDFIKASALTGARVGELRLLTVKCFEVLNGSGLLNIQHSKTGPRSQRLSSEATALFKQLSEGREPNEPLLLNASGKAWTNAQLTTSTAELRDKGRLPDECVMYSLRHYHISRALLSGFNAIALARNVGTSIKMLEDHYAKFMNEDIYSMLDQIET